MIQSQISIKEFYHNHASEIRVTARVLRIVSIIPKWISGLKVLDVGCGNGFITQCMGIYADVKGIDIDDDASEYKSTIKYDVVTCFDVLEHVDDLFGALTNISSLCKKNGLIIVNQPEQTDKKQPVDNLVALMDLIHLGKLVYLENYKFNNVESYNFMVFKNV